MTSLVTKDQWQKLLTFITENFDGHAIASEKSLVAMAEAIGMTYVRTARTNKGVIRDSDGNVFITQNLKHRDKFEAEIAEENLGGWIAGGDWYAFTPLYMVDDLARDYADYRSPKMGRGSRFWDSVEALKKHVEAMP